MNKAKSQKKRSGTEQESYSLKLHPDNDGDIIAWLDEQGNKQGAIKDALRAFINGGGSANTTAQGVDSDSLLSKMDERFNYLYEQMTREFETTRKAIGKATISTESKPLSNGGGELKPELKNAMLKAKKTGFKLES